MQLNAVVQLANFSEEIDFGLKILPDDDSVTFVSASVVTSPAQPNDGVISVPDFVTLTNTSDVTNLKYTFAGNYGLNIAIDDIYKVITFNPNFTSFETTYTDYDQLNAATYDHLTNFLPLDWSFKTYTYNFTVVINNVPSSVQVTQLVTPNMDRHYTRIKSLVSKEIIGEEIPI